MQINTNIRTSVVTRLNYGFLLGQHSSKCNTFWQSLLWLSISGENLNKKWAIHCKDKLLNDILPKSHMRVDFMMNNGVIRWDHQSNTIVWPCIGQDEQVNVRNHCFHNNMIDCWMLLICCNQNFMQNLHWIVLHNLFYDGWRLDGHLISFSIQQQLGLKQAMHLHQLIHLLQDLNPHIGTKPLQYGP